MIYVNFRKKLILRDTFNFIMSNIEKEIEKFYFNSDPFWESLPLSIAKSLKLNAQIVHYKKNEPMYNEGDYPKGLYIIKKGIASLTVIDNNGRQQILYFLRKNDIYGYRSLIVEKATMINISALEDCEVEIVNKAVFLHYLHNSIDLNKALLKHMGIEIKVLIHKISYFSLKPVNERIAMALLILHQKLFSKKKDNTISLPKADIANFAGTIPETLSRQLKTLSTMNAISVKGRKITIINQQLLFEISNID